MKLCVVERGFVGAFSKQNLNITCIGDYSPAHRLNVNVLLSNITFFVIFAVLDVSFAVNSCLNRSFFYIYVCSFITFLKLLRGTGYMVQST